MTNLVNPAAPQLAQGQNGTPHINAALEALSTTLVYATAALPAASTLAGQMVMVSDGAAGAECLAFSDGAAWHRIVLGAAPNVSS